MISCLMKVEGWNRQLFSLQHFTTKNKVERDVVVMTDLCKKAESGDRPLFPYPRFVRFCKRWKVEIDHCRHDCKEW